MSNKIKIAHVINPFKCDLNHESYLYYAQPITFESMRIAKEKAQENNICIDLFSANFQEDNDYIPKFFKILPNLKKSTQSLFPKISKNKKLPIIQEIFDLIYNNTDADYVIFTNSDIGIQKNFYIQIHNYIKENGLQSFIINRRDNLPKFKNGHRLTKNDLDVLYNENGNPHPGKDCFIISRKLMSRIKMIFMFTGFPPWGDTLCTILEKIDPNFKLFKDLHLTFHIGSDCSWKTHEIHQLHKQNSIIAKKVLDDYNEIPKLIEKIYVINLEKSKDRKNHIINEFRKKCITNYNFFEATDKNDDQVTKIMNDGFVKKFPPCFRCNKNKCKCENNVLTKNQIGNWCSYINLMKHIISNNNDGLIMICEDDIKFTNNGLDILGDMITPQKFKKYKIDLNKPVLIRIGAAYCDRHNSGKIFTFNKQIIMSNPAFVINKQYAKIFMDNLKSINHTSDVYIHKQLIEINNTIQHWTINPLPIYELSYGTIKKFKSEIHPKKFNDEDIELMKTYVKRMEYKDFLCVGHPRCGTASISNYFCQMGYDVRHENMGNDGVSSWMLAVEDEYYPWGDVKDRFRYYFKNIIHIVRNPFDAIPSIILENKYSPENKSYEFRKKYIEIILGIKFPDINFDAVDLKTEIELAIKTFLYWNKICKLLKPTCVCKLEDISTIQKFNKNNVVIQTVVKNSSKLYQGKKYNKPNITPQSYSEINPILKEELKEFCDEYGYKYIL